MLAVLCERLKLPEVGRLAAARAQQAAAEQWTYSQYLIDVFQAEVAARQDRYVVSHTQMSHLPFHKTLDQYDFTFQPSLDERQVRQLLTLQWVDGAENLIVCAGQRESRVGSSPTGARMQGAISKRGGNASWAARLAVRRAGCRS